MLSEESIEKRNKQEHLCQESQRFEWYPLSLDYLSFIGDKALDPGSGKYAGRLSYNPQITTCLSILMILGTGLHNQFREFQAPLISALEKELH